MANYKIEDIEGIGTTIGEKLRNAGISNTDTLLDLSKTATQRKTLAEKTGLADVQILKYANMVDLYRVNGIGSEYAQLLEASGVDTIPELAQRNAENLTTKLSEVNEQKKLTRKVPTVTEVTGWVNQAKELPRVIEF